MACCIRLAFLLHGFLRKVSEPSAHGFIIFESNDKYLEFCDRTFNIKIFTKWWKVFYILWQIWLLSFPAYIRLEQAKRGRGKYPRINVDYASGTWQGVYDFHFIWGCRDSRELRQLEVHPTTKQGSWIWTQVCLSAKPDKGSVPWPWVHDLSQIKSQICLTD